MNKSYSQTPLLKNRKKTCCGLNRTVIIAVIIFCIIVIVAAIVIPIYAVRLAAVVGTTTIATVTVNLPPQCSNYTLDIDMTRLTSYTATITACDNTFTTPRWVRFSGGGATQIATSATPANRCGTSGTGWLVSSLPSTVGANVTGLVCYSLSNNICNQRNWIPITNCNGFYVFLLSNTPACNYRYCTE